MPLYNPQSPIVSDPQIVDVAGLTPTDNGVIIGNGTNFVVESGTTLRTSIGLGTSATVNTGTSDATIPLLNATNTWSGQQRFSSGIVLQLVTTAALEAVGNAINKTDKIAGKIAWNTNTAAIVVASGPAAGDVWYTYPAVGTHTPV